MNDGWLYNNLGMTHLPGRICGRLNSEGLYLLLNKLTSELPTIKTIPVNNDIPQICPEEPWVSWMDPY